MIVLAQNMSRDSRKGVRRLNSLTKVLEYQRTGWILGIMERVYVLMTMRLRSHEVLCLFVHGLCAVDNVRVLCDVMHSRDSTRQHESSISVLERRALDPDENQHPRFPPARWNLKFNLD